jgi:hypothetical protein
MPETRSAFKIHLAQDMLDQTSRAEYSLTLIPTRESAARGRGFVTRRSRSLLRAARGSRSHPPWEPREHVEALGEVQDGLCSRQRDPNLPGHREPLDLGLGGLEGPEAAVDISAPHVTFTVRGLEAVTLGQEVLERPGSALERLTNGQVAGRKLCFQHPPVRPDAPVADLVTLEAAVHLGVEVA